MARPIGTTGKAKIMDDSQLKTFLKRLSNDTSARHQSRNTALIACSYLLGLRSIELCNLDIGDIFENGEIKHVLKLTSLKTKYGKHRDVYLSNKMLRKHLMCFFENDDLYLCTEADPLFRSQKNSRFSPNSMQQLVKRIHGYCGHTGYSSHSGRRSLITNLVHAGIDIHSVSKIAGHSNISTTQIYVQDNPHMLSDILKHAF